MKLQVAIYLNESEGHFWGYRDGAELHKAYDYEIECEPTTLADPAFFDSIAEQAFDWFNAPPEILSETGRQHAARYRAGHNRSLSVGDVVVVGEVALAVASMGFDRVSIGADQVRADTTTASDKARSALGRMANSPGEAPEVGI